eukprot:UN02224
MFKRKVIEQNGNGVPVSVKIENGKLYVCQPFQIWVGKIPNDNILKNAAGIFRKARINLQILFDPMWVTKLKITNGNGTEQLLKYRDSLPQSKILGECFDGDGYGYGF